MSFYCRVADCTLRDTVRSSVTLKELRAEPLLIPGGVDQGQG